MTIRLTNGRTLEIKNVSIALHDDSMRIQETIRRGLVPTRSLPEDAIVRKTEEVLIGWADRVVVTDRRMIITSEGSQPTVQHECEWKNIEHYSA